MEKKERHETPLCTLKNGETGTIIYIKTGLGKGIGRSRGFKKRLMDMGLTPGTKVTVMNTAPFHGPLEILVRNSKLALGRGLAERILVEIN
jgi:DtxR family Mn-dependent transcriptional regulator